MRLVFWELLDCVGRDFSPSWSDLYRSLTDTIATVKATAVAKRAVARWRNFSAAAWSILPLVLSGEESQRELKGFCVYGYCAAVYHILRSSQDFELLEEFKACASWDDEWWPWNFLSDTRWARLLSPLDLLHIHTEQKEMWLASHSLNLERTSSHYALEDGSLLSFHEESPRWSGWRACKSTQVLPSSDLYLLSYGVQLRGALEAFTNFGGYSVKSRRRSDQASSLVIAAFGVHFTTLLEPISAIRQLLPADLKISAAFYGSSHPPPDPIVQEVCPSDSQSLNCYLSSSPSLEFWQALVDSPSLADAATRLAAVLATQEFIKMADGIVCGGGHSPTLCFLLRMVTRAPMLFTLQAPLSFRMPLDADKRALLVALFREMASETLASTSSAYLQRQVWVQTGSLLPVVRNHNWYAATVPGRWGDEGAQTPKEIIFWQNHIALKANCSMVLWRFMKQAVEDDFPFNLVFKNVRNLPTARPGRRVYSLKDQDSSMLSFGAIRQRYLGAVLFPHDLGMFSFDDLYALGVPIFLPEDHLIVNIAFAQLISTKNYPWYLLRGEHAKLKFNHGDADALPPWDPGWDGINAVDGDGRATWLGHDALGVDRLLESMSVSNFKLYPHIRRFRSLSALIHMIGCMRVEDLLATGEAMRHSAQEAWKVTAEYYRHAVIKLLGIRLA